jgi:hypothetical protein
LIEAANCIAQEFYTISGGYRLSFNDMSLPWGGMFDNNSRFFVIPNSPGNSHAFHRRGTGMDVNTTATKDAGGTITIGPTHPFVITVAAACNTWLIPEPQIHFELIGPAFGF